MDTKLSHIVSARIRLERQGPRREHLLTESFTQLSNLLVDGLIFYSLHRNDIRLLAHIQDNQRQRKVSQIEHFQLCVVVSCFG